jgi:hypothetical protein
MKRRDLLKTVVAGAAAGAKAQTSASGAWKPAFFDAHQNETVIALTELIIPATDTPGAKAALVNRFIDLMLSESPAEQQSRFVQGLAWLDAYARRKHGVPFVKCGAEQQTALLGSLDPAANPPSDLRPGVRFFEEIKRRTVAGYYTSKIGVDELNKGGRVPSSFGCPHGGHSV